MLLSSPFSVYVVARIGVIYHFTAPYHGIRFYIQLLGDNGYSVASVAGTDVCALSYHAVLINYGIFNGSSAAYMRTAHDDAVYDGGTRFNDNTLG